MRRPPYSYILLEQEDILRIHIFLSNKNTSSISISSYPTRRHLPYPYILLQQEDTIYSSPTRQHLFFSNKKTSILVQQDNICSSPTTRHVLVPQEDISCLHTTYTMSQEHTYRVHRDQTWSKSKKLKILTFSRD